MYCTSTGCVTLYGSTTGTGTGTYRYELVLYRFRYILVLSVTLSICTVQVLSEVKVKDYGEIYGLNIPVLSPNELISVQLRWSVGQSIYTVREGTVQIQRIHTVCRVGLPWIRNICSRTSRMPCPRGLLLHVPTSQMTLLRTLATFS